MPSDRDAALVVIKLLDSWQVLRHRVKNGVSVISVVSSRCLDSALCHLLHKRIPVIYEEDRRAGTFRGQSAYFHDPDGHVVELFERPAA